jgi:hypothetical protein
MLPTHERLTRAKANVLMIFVPKLAVRLIEDDFLVNAVGSRRTRREREQIDQALDNDNVTIVLIEPFLVRTCTVRTLINLTIMPKAA